MTCARLEEVLVQTPSADALAHAKTCATCGPARAAWDAMEPAQKPTAPGEISASGLKLLKQSAQEELKAHPKAHAWWWDVLVLLAVDFGIVTTGLALLNLAQAQSANHGITALLVALMALGAWAAIRPGAHVVRLGVVACAALAAMWAGLGGSGLAPDRPFGNGVGCAATEAGLAVVPLAAVLWATTRFAFDFWRALVGGISVGAAGMLVLHVHCGDGSAAHLFAFHVAPWLVISGAAALLRRALPSKSYAR